MTDMENTQGVIKALKQIPPAKAKSKLIGTVIGLAIAVFGWYAKAQWPELPTWVAYSTTAFGFVMASGEYIKAPWRLFVAMVRDVVDLVRGGEATPPDESNE